MRRPDTSKIASRDVAQPFGGCHAETACRHRRRRLCASAITLGQSQLEIEANELWFVELSSPPASDGTTIAALEREEASFHAAASGRRSPLRERSALPQPVERADRQGLGSRPLEDSARCRASRRSIR